jgi:hypothetical protein
VRAGCSQMYAEDGTAVEGSGVSSPVVMHRDPPQGSRRRPGHRPRHRHRVPPGCDRERGHQAAVPRRHHQEAGLRRAIPPGRA